jgi:hypothetical protein
MLMEQTDRQIENDRARYPAQNGAWRTHRPASHRVIFLQERARILFGERFASIERGGALDRAPYVIPLARFDTRRALRSEPLVLQRLARVLRALPKHAGVHFLL